METMIPVPELAKTLQDAMTVARKFGMRYTGQIHYASRRI
jgi:hypothetical protein